MFNLNPYKESRSFIKHIMPKQLSIALATAAAGVSIGSTLFNIGRSLFGQPEFPVNAADINKEIDLAMNRALSESASNTRRRLIGAGQGGSGSIDAAISDNQNRIRGFFEEQRVKALNLLRQAEFGRDQQAFDNLTNVLGGLTDIGFSGALLLGGGNQTTGLNPSQQDNLSLFGNLSQIGLGNAGNFTGQGIQAIQPRGTNLPQLKFNTPLQPV